jgi:sirohydrochlorin ferrochelatase
MRTARLTVVLVAHGSRDPRAAESTEALARAVRRAHPSWEVRASYLDHAGPRPLDVLARSRRAVLVPLLLTSAYHGRVDLPAILRAAEPLPVSVTATDVLGPASPRLLAALRRRLPSEGLDAVVLAAAGTRDDAARATVADAAAALGESMGLPSAVAYASGPGPRADEAVAGLRAAGARRVGTAAYFLAPGLLFDSAVRAAREAGAIFTAEPLGDAPELVALIGARVAAASTPLRAAA